MDKFRNGSISNGHFSKIFCHHITVSIVILWLSFISHLHGVSCYYISVCVANKVLFSMHTETDSTDTWIWTQDLTIFREPLCTEDIHSTFRLITFSKQVPDAVHLDVKHRYIKAVPTQKKMWLLWLEDNQKSAWNVIWHCMKDALNTFILELLKGPCTDPAVFSQEWGSSSIFQKRGWGSAFVSREGERTQPWKIYLFV